MQLAVIETCRNTLGLKDATSEEFDPKASTKAVVFMPEISKSTMGGNMRLGKRTTHFVVKDCLAKRLYNNSESVDERHRHR